MTFLLTVHEGKKMFTCEFCGKSYGHSGHLGRHIGSAHRQERPHKCDLCGFRFFQASHLKSHIQHIHNMSRAYQCAFCSLRVSSEANLREHLRTLHGSEERYKCPMRGCGAGHTLEVELQRHILRVHGQSAGITTDSNLSRVQPG